jgi:hypothetical protein
MTNEPNPDLDPVGFLQHYVAQTNQISRLLHQLATNTLPSMPGEEEMTLFSERLDAAGEMLISLSHDPTFLDREPDQADVVMGTLAPFWSVRKEDGQWRVIINPDFKKMIPSLVAAGLKYDSEQFDKLTFDKAMGEGNDTPQ